MAVQTLAPNCVRRCTSTDMTYESVQIAAIGAEGMRCEALRNAAMLKKTLNRVIYGDT